MVSYYLLVVHSARSTHSASLIVFFKSCFFQSKSNFVKYGSGPEHWSFEPDTGLVGIRLRPALKSQKHDCITSIAMSGLQDLDVAGRRRRSGVVKASITKLIDRVRDLELKIELSHYDRLEAKRF